MPAAKAPAAAPVPAAPLPAAQPAISSDASAQGLINSLFSKRGMEADARLIDYVSTMPHGAVASALQDSKIDLSQARNPSAYLMGLLKRRGPDDGMVGGAGYEGGRARGGKKLKATAAAKKQEEKATTVAASAPASSEASAANGTFATAAGSRQKARGGSESKKRREEARKAKREQWERSQAH